MEQIATSAGLKALVRKVRSQKGYQRPLMAALGVSHCATNGEERHLLDFNFPRIYENDSLVIDVLAHVTDHLAGNGSYALAASTLGRIGKCLPLPEDAEHIPIFKTLKRVGKILEHRGGNVPMCASVAFIGDVNQAPVGVADAYLRLCLRSERWPQANKLNITGVERLLPLVAWTSEGPIAIEELEDRKWKALERGSPLTIRSVDRFPALIDYVSPQNVVLEAAGLVRLGCQLQPGAHVRRGEHVQRLSKL